MENRIRQHREAKALTLEDLADEAGTTDAEISLIEAGSRSVKLELALQICAALETQLAVLFPGTAPLLEKFPLPIGGLLPKGSDRQDLVTAFEQAGIDIDPRNWSLTLRLRSGAIRRFEVTPRDVHRLRRNLEVEDSRSRFFAFTAPDREVAVNLSHLLYYHEMFDAPGEGTDEMPEEIQAVQVFFSGDPIPLEVRVVPDGREEEYGGDFESLLLLLEHPLQPGTFVELLDSDHESVFLRADDVELIEAPLWVTHPDLFPECGCEADG